ncbi:hypothetical protein GCM10010140_77150 [Streptosporangium pseudovulgare]|uniref:DUF4158 domain-containing protein n=1 Tax=Streptosporangium pseudovulgare TaxID=35765 RepID=A0ABQ2RKF4_9ACTN|nr:hypothetical protein GCM10010140_77150 [Streptosporangium pseudovulgare]
MPVEFLSDEQAARYGACVGAPSRAELERFFFLDDAASRPVRRTVSTISTAPACETAPAPPPRTRTRTRG